MGSERRSVDPGQVLLEQSKIDRASEFIDGVEDLSGLSTDDREHMQEVVGRMLTAAEIVVFDGQPGMQHISTIHVDIEGSDTAKAIVIGAEKQERDVKLDIRWMEQDELTAVIEEQKRSKRNN